MKYYFYSVGLLLLVIVFTFVLPTTVDFGEKVIATSPIPLNNAAVAGIEKYNPPPYSKGLPTPSLTARAVLVEDLNTDTVLYQNNAYESVPIASTTKVMTALIADRYYKQNALLTANEAADVDGSRVGLQKGEVLSFRSLLYGMLLDSGNDAAYAIAENYPGGVDSFVAAMNNEVQVLDLHNTHFDNPVGFDSPNHYSSAYDMSKITDAALQDPELAKVFATKDTDITSLDKRFNYHLVNLNQLLTSVQGVLGVKTGYTDLAKENLITYVDRSNHKILTVVLGSDDRFGESTKLIEWTYSNYVWQD